MAKITPELRSEITTTLRLLAADGVERARSGHPGAPLGLADLAFALWHDHLRFDPGDPAWPARDRFVLSNGHASMLLYSLLHLWGFEVSLDDLRSFRQWGSVTPGHPESFMTPGVETTTGPLGQGIGNSVGMALAARLLAARFDDDVFAVMPQRIFAICGDGDLMEGLSSEAASLAGHWRLGNLVWLYDDNKITIDGTTELAFTEDVARRFEAFGWQVERADGHDGVAVSAAVSAALADRERPAIVICRTHIGFGSPNKIDTSGVHGSPLGTDELARTREALGWAGRPPFHVPEAVRAFFTEARAEKAAEHQAWRQGFAAWRDRDPARAARFDALWSGEVPADLWQRLLAAAPAEGATRAISGAVLAAAARQLPSLIGGSADLAGSNKTALPGMGLVGHPKAAEGYELSFEGRQIGFGIREHAMGAVTNGMLYHGGVRPFGATFLVFADYVRPAIRLAALSHLPNIFVFTHDSFFLGEDGPTHQPVEHMWSLRIIPGLTCFRPADGVEVAMSWAWALQRAQGPVALALTRQGVPPLARPAGFEPRDVWRGAYVVQAAEDPEVVLIGTGSEVHLCVAAAEALELRARVISMPSWALFQSQGAAYRRELLGVGVPVVSVEAGVTAPWAALADLSIGIDRFGASAPPAVLAEQFGLTAAQVSDRIRAFLQTHQDII